MEPFLSFFPAVSDDLVNRSEVPEQREREVALLPGPLRSNQVTYPGPEFVSRESLSMSEVDCFCKMLGPIGYRALATAHSAAVA